MAFSLYAPLLPLCLSLIAGLLVGSPAGDKTLALTAALLAALGGRSLRYRKGPPYLLLLVLAFPTGIFLSYNLHHPHFPPEHLLQQPLSEITALKGVLLRDAEPRGRGTAILLAAEEALTGRGWIRVKGAVRLWVRGEVDLDKGTRIEADVKLGRPHSFANPGAFDYEAYLARRGIFVTGSIRRTPKVLYRKEGILSFTRARWKKALSLHSRDDTRGFLEALLLGRRGNLSKGDKEIMRRTGTYHLLAISGLHIATLSGLLFLALRWPLRRWQKVLARGWVEGIAALLAIPLVVLYILMVGAPLSAVRAGIMVAAFTFALLLGRRKAMVNALAFAALLILCSWPGALWEPSFQLSFSAVCGILLFGQRLLSTEGRGLEATSSSPLKKLTMATKAAVALSVAAQLSTLPIVLHHFHLLSIVAPLANLVAVPVVALVALPLGILSLPLALYDPSLTNPFITGASWAVSFTLTILKGLASLPLSHLWLPGPTVPEALAFYLLLISVGFWRKVRLKRLLLGALVLFVAMDTVHWYLRTRPSGALEVTFLDVGQGDAAFLRLPGGKTALIDGGGLLGSDFDIGERVIAPFLWRERILKVDYIVLSHPQPDHYRGLLFVARHFHPKEFWYAASDLPPDLRRLLRELKLKGVKVRRIGKGFKREISGVEFTVLHPPAGWHSDVNDASLVLRVIWGDRSVLFTGDIGHLAEAEMVRRGLPLRAEVIKVPHHGSRHSSSYPFVREVSPLYAVISVGWRNPFGHPAERTILRYQGIGATVLRTDLDGAITFRGDLKGWTLQTFRGRTSGHRAR